MTIHDTKQMRQTALQRLGTAPQEKTIVLIYAGITVGTTLLVLLIDFLLGSQISQTGGLSNMGLRTVLSTIQNVVPILQSLALMCLELGYLAAMLRISRGQYTSPQTLRAGIQRFWLLLRCNLFQWMFYMIAMMASVYLGIQIFMLSPLSGRVYEILEPVLADMTVLSGAVPVVEEATSQALANALIPCFVIIGVLAAAVMIPMSYSFRMVNYVILDKPGISGMMAIRESRMMMRRHRIHLFRVDLGLWWYYALLLLAMVVGYGDVLLPMVGVMLPWSEELSYYLFYFLLLAAQFAVYYFCRNRVAVTYALAYDTLRPQEPKDNGIVLGNIFDMR